MTTTEYEPRVLVIDDDKPIRTLVSLALRRAGMQVVEASTGEEGMISVLEEQPDVIVCDLGMPGMSGLEVIRRLRADPATSTLPVLLMTGSGDANTVIEALEAGATDFLTKPIRMDELVARTRAHARTQTAWGQQIQRELQARAMVVSAMGQLATHVAPEEIAEQVVTLLGDRIDATFCSILALQGTGRLISLATYDRVNGALRGGSALPLSRSRDLIARASDGAWVEGRPVRPPDEADGAFWDVAPNLLARAPVYAGDQLVAILVIGSHGGDHPERAERGRLLATAIDLAGVLGAAAGPALADRSAAESVRARLRRILTQGQLRTVYQPIVQIASNSVIGWEALTRFDDGTPPEVRFAEARLNELGTDFELAAIESSLAGSANLPRGGLLALNISPTVVVDARRRIARALEARDGRRVVLELSEHTAISDYASIRSATEALGMELAVDDAGAGYSSLRHLLELRPAFAKLDISLVRGVHDDPVRQALVAGLAHYARQTGCQLIAEGVEQSAESETLQGLGVELGQGYLFGRPEPSESARLE